MIKLDIATSQVVWFEGEEAVIRHISKHGQNITLEIGKGKERRKIDVSADELLWENPDMVYEVVN